MAGDSPCFGSIVDWLLASRVFAPLAVKTSGMWKTLRWVANLGESPIPKVQRFPTHPIRDTSLIGWPRFSPILGAMPTTFREREGKSSH